MSELSNHAVAEKILHRLYDGQDWLHDNHAALDLLMDQANRWQISEEFDSFTCFIFFNGKKRFVSGRHDTLSMAVCEALLEMAKGVQG